MCGVGSPESGAEPTPARVAQALREQGRVLGDAEVLGAAQQLRSELVGSGPLEPLLADPSVTDVLVSAPDRVWVDRGSGLELAPVSFPDAGAVRRLAQRLATVAGRRLDDARPWVDARLPDGTRLHAVLPPVAVDCTCLSLRVVRPRAFTLDELTAAGTGPPGGDRVLRALLRARLSFLVSGGTGSGKTTLLSALLGLVGPDERIVLAEDSAELRPDHPHVVRWRPDRRTRRPRVWSPWRTWCVRRCACGRTGWSWARYAVPKWSICLPP
ncbi:TadA family conjugal transfer-associated ATPase OS=Streptomyces tendae OX=1932 GN=GUR47_19250 PE=3 SV=1 [Streptomyces tendae]